MGSTLNKNTKLTIGRLASASGVGISTVRYYQKRGLLRQPDRPASGTFRSYSAEDLSRLLLIKEAQELGFTLAEIADLIRYVDDQNCAAITSLANKKLQGIRAQIKTLQNMRRALTALIDSCRHEDCSQCPLIQRLHNRTTKGRQGT